MHQLLISCLCNADNASVVDIDADEAQISSSLQVLRQITQKLKTGSLRALAVKTTHELQTGTLRACA